MTEEDARRWDARWRDDTDEQTPGPPGAFVDHADAFPRSGNALVLACGVGLTAVWLAQRGLDVLAVDVSSVAVQRVRQRADGAGVSDRVEALVHDLDRGLPPGPPADVVVCHLFRDARLDQPIVERLVPGGLLAIAALSEVGASPGPFRAAAGELDRAFAALEVAVSGEAEGRAWLLARRPTTRAR